MDRPAPQRTTPQTSHNSAAKPGEPARASKEKLIVPAILDKLDAADDSRFRNRRSGDRLRFRRTVVPVKIVHPGGSTIERTVATRNLSASGVGFLYDSFLHNGTRVTIRLPRRLGGEDALGGAVVYCAHVAGAYHQVGVRFDQKIFSKLYSDESERTPVPTTPAALASNADKLAKALSGRLLVVDAQAMDRMLIARHLRETSMTVATAADMTAAVANIREEPTPFDVVLIEVDLGTPSGVTMLEELRSAGHKGTIIAGTAARVLPEARVWAEAQRIGAILAKPYDRAELVMTLAATLMRPPTVGGVTAAMDGAVKAVEQGVADVKTLVEVCRSAK